MESIHLNHPIDLETEPEALDLFAEEVPDSQWHGLPPNSFSTIACECDISTFYCYGCGGGRVGLPRDIATEGVAGNLDSGDFQTSLNWAREKMSASAPTDKAAEVVQMLFRKG
jgi:hypothetical protein